jgi:hypothetical protein
MRLFTLYLVAALSCVCAARGADLRVATLAPVEDISLPFWCDWGYDWNERCYREDGSRLGVGGEDDKVWRSALRFSTASVPPGASVVTAELSLWYDRTCIAPRRTSRTCDGRAFEVGAHPILTPRWPSEREVEFGPQAGAGALPAAAASQWMVLDLTDLVAEWVSGAQPNNGVLLKLDAAQEDYGSSGPLFPSSSFATAEVRPRLTVWYVPSS